jgi:hypothetical protein
VVVVVVLVVVVVVVVFVVVVVAVAVVVVEHPSLKPTILIPLSIFVYASPPPSLDRTQFVHGAAAETHSM